IATQLIDAAKRLHRVTFGVAPLPENYNVGLSGVTVAVAKVENGKREEVMKKFHRFVPRNQLLHETLPAGSYELTFTPRNAKGRDGEEMLKMMELNSASTGGVVLQEQKAVREVDVSKAVEEIMEQLFAIFNQLRTILGKRLR
ncbi:MAG: hypothetical protein Q7R85_04750, partial [bacterium]|nr:hypothetical protein [bacterium]